MRSKSLADSGGTETAITWDARFGIVLHSITIATPGGQRARGGCRGEVPVTGIAREALTAPAEETPPYRDHPTISQTPGPGVPTVQGPTALGVCRRGCSMVA